MTKTQRILFSIFTYGILYGTLLGAINLATHTGPIHLSGAPLDALLGTTMGCVTAGVIEMLVERARSGYINPDLSRSTVNRINLINIAIIGTLPGLLLGFVATTGLGVTPDILPIEYTVIAALAALAGMASSLGYVAIRGCIENRADAREAGETTETVSAATRPVPSYGSVTKFGSTPQPAATDTQSLLSSGNPNPYQRDIEQRDSTRSAAVQALGSAPSSNNINTSKVDLEMGITPSQ
jgi:hypothetical protein